MAPTLLGGIVSTDTPEGRVAVRLTEVEAYDGERDPASHAHRGRTRRNAPMFERAGTLYVYRSYGIHWCMNVVTGAVGVPSAVLLRGGVVIAGEDLARRRRGRDDHLADGPGKLCQALGIDGSDSGSTIDTGRLSLELAERPMGVVRATPRIGITRATDRPWRFVLDTERGP